MVVASSRLPFASGSASLHSIIPAPVASRSFFTSAALISAITAYLRSVPSFQFGNCTKKRRPIVQAGGVYSKRKIRLTPGTSPVQGEPDDRHGRGGRDRRLR